MKPLAELKPKSMRFLAKISSLALIAGLAFIPMFVSAQIGGIVPCGNAGQNPCTFCDLIQLANNLINFAFTFIVLPLFAVGMMAAGVTILTARGSINQVLKGRQMLVALVVGFFIAASAWVIVKLILTTFITGGPIAFLTNGFTLPSCIK